MKVIGIIPARYGSIRFPGKPLAMIQGKPMIQHVYEHATQAIEEVWVATDDERIMDIVGAFGGCVVMTSPDCKNGTERCAEVVKQLLRINNDDIIVNIQGDMPFITPHHIHHVLQLFEVNPIVKIGTLITPLDAKDSENKNVVKVSVGIYNTALYFTRYTFSVNHFYKHIGLYAFRKKTLLEIVNLPQVELEIKSSLEQIRWMWYGYDIHCAFSFKDVISIDIPEDLQKL